MSSRHGNGAPHSHLRVHQGREAMNPRPALRGNARRQRFQMLINEAESGCASHIRALAEEWPDDIALAERALSAILGHTDVNEIAQLHNDHLTNTPDPEDPPAKSILITACVTAIEAAFAYLETASLDYVKQLLETFWPHLPGFLATLNYCAHHGPWLASGTHVWGRELHSGNAIRATLIGRLLDVGLDSLKAQPDYEYMGRRIVDDIVRAWLWGVRGEREGRDAGEALQTPEEYAESHQLHLLRVLWICIADKELLALLLQKISESSRKFHKLVIQSFFHRCREWVAVHKNKIDADPTTDCSNLVRLVLACHSLGADPKFSRAWVKANFSSFILHCARQANFKAALTASNCGGVVATELAAIVFLPRRIHAYELLHTVPDLLDAGLLTFMIDDLLAGHSLDTEVFPLWWDRNPLQDLYSLSHHPRVSRALLRAIAKLPQGTKEAIEANPLARRHWGVFMESMELYEAAWERWVSDEGGADVCDNLRHHANGYGPVTKSFACTRCEAVLYCSPVCQREDWEALHRTECEGARATRIRCQLQGIWLSPSSRMGYFRFLEQGLLQQVLPRREERRQALSTCCSRGSSEDSESGLEGDLAVYWADTQDSPMAFERVGMEEFCEENVSGLLYVVDPRGRSLLGMADEESTFLMSAGSAIGAHFISVLAVFRVVHQPLQSDGTQPPPKALLLHGMIKTQTNLGDQG